ncbi:MAG: SUMF1/EgtB/PvdO family nonheme iron enzyme [Archangiaceae bacterium]|nr:SUMF1/EgtB/PvdO family nonheme iron enzyme [Archangiaceae bacterium]
MRWAPLAAAVLGLTGCPSWDGPQRFHRPSCALAPEGCQSVTVGVSEEAFNLGAELPASAWAVTDAGYFGAPAVAVVLDTDFEIDAHEVTVARFRTFWDAGMPAPADGASIAYPGGASLAWQAGWAPRPPLLGAEDVLTPEDRQADCNWSPNPQGAESRPINCVDWVTALAFCVWDGSRLPTETEWEWLARDLPVTQAPSPRWWPWGDAAPEPGSPPPASTCRLLQFSRCADAVTLSVGRFAPTGGVYDLAGNVAEWAADDFDTYGSNACWPGGTPVPVDPLCRHPDGPSDTPRVVRGGSGLSRHAVDVATTARAFAIPSRRTPGIGFRCARSRL